MRGRPKSTRRLLFNYSAPPSEDGKWAMFIDPSGSFDFSKTNLKEITPQEHSPDERFGEFDSRLITTWTKHPYGICELWRFDIHKALLFVFFYVSMWFQCNENQATY